MARVIEVYRRTLKQPDLFWNRWVCRPLAAVLVAALEKTRVTPNQITFAAFGLALLSACLLLFLPGYWGILLAILVYELSYVLDCADGMLARLRGVASPAGHLLDFLMDELKAFALLAAVAARLYLDLGAEQYLLLGLAGVVLLASGVAITTFQRRPEIAYALSARVQNTELHNAEQLEMERAPTPKNSSVSRLLALPLMVAKLLIHYPSYIWIAALAGDLRWYFYPYLAVNALYVGKSILWLLLRFGRFEEVR